MKQSKVLPQRPISHVVGDHAVNIFVSLCDPSWVVTQVQKDYGLDLRIEVARGEYVSGEEFSVQIKGRTLVKDAAEYLPQAKVRQATVNYWLGKLAPTMVAIVDTTSRTVFYDWLEHCYSGYPNGCQTDKDVLLPLRHSSSTHDIREEALAYLRSYYASMSNDMERLSRGIYLSNLLFSISALHRLSTRAAIDLQQLEPSSSEDLKHFLLTFCVAFASHDKLMEGLRIGEFGHRPESNSRFFRLIDQKLTSYDEVRRKFIVYRGETPDGNYMVEPKYKEISAWLLPMIGVLEDIEETLGLAQVTNKMLVNNVHL
jgi:hypothetical protein